MFELNGYFSRKLRGGKERIKECEKVTYISTDVTVTYSELPSMIIDQIISMTYFIKHKILFSLIDDNENEAEISEHKIHFFTDTHTHYSIHLHL